MSDPTYLKIYAAVEQIPTGKVTSYGEVASYVGLFRGARIVGWALKALPAESTIPWQRVVNKEGVITIINPHITQYVQKELLEKEGVPVFEDEGRWRVNKSVWWQFPN
jgi:methylated-DNA-protein-cysteine methyltransferase-like protein